MSTIPSESAITKLPAPPLPAGVTLSAGDLTPPKRQGGDRWAVLAGLRFFLAFTVLAGHCATHAGITGLHSWCDFFLRLNQGSAVLGFLVVSGYSIAASIERPGGGKQSYAERRINRIYPVYLASLVLAFVASYLYSAKGALVFPSGMSFAVPTPVQWFAMPFMLQGIVAPVVAADSQAWTLAVEWWMYAIAPALNRLRDRLAAITIAIAGVSCAVYLLESPKGVEAAELPYGGSIAMLAWVWLTGFLYYRYKSSPWAVALLVFPTMLAEHVGGFVGLPMIFSLFVVMMCDRIKLPAIAARLCVWLGDISYPLYMFQIPVICILYYLGVASPTGWAVTAVVVSIVTYYAIDRPTRGKFRFLPDRKVTV